MVYSTPSKKILKTPWARYRVSSIGEVQGGSTSSKSTSSSLSPQRESWKDRKWYNSGGLVHITSWTGHFLCTLPFSLCSRRLTWWTTSGHSLVFWRSRRHHQAAEDMKRAGCVLACFQVSCLGLQNSKSSQVSFSHSYFFLALVFHVLVPLGHNMEMLPHCCSAWGSAPIIAWFLYK